MPYSLRSRHDIKINFFILIFFALSAIIFTFPVVFNMSSSMYGKFYNTDLRGAIWNLWWGKYAILNHMNYNQCPFLAAPFGIDLSQAPVSWIVKAVFGAMLIFFNPAFCFNFLALVSFVLCGYFTFKLVYFLLNDINAALAASFIFTFSPYHLNKVMEFGFFFIGNWFVLYVWALLRLREQISLRNILFASISIALIAAFNPYYGFFAFIFTVFFIIFIFFYRWKIKNEFKSTAGQKFKILLSICAVFIIGALINFPTLLLIVKNMFFSNATAASKASLGYIRPVEYLVAQSARPLSYLLPPSTHPIFGEFTKKMFGSIFYGRGPIEQTLYLGCIPVCLAYVAFLQWRHKRSAQAAELSNSTFNRDNFYIGFFMYIACVAFLFSMPPHLNLGLLKVYFPSYYIYKVLPMFRAYARFGMIVMLSVSILAAYGFKHISNKIRPKKIQILSMTALLLVCLFEFINIPPLKVTFLNKIPPIYNWLSEQKGDFIVAEYPFTLGSAGEAQVNYDYLYYQTIHQKRMVNGAPLGTDAFEIQKRLLKITDPAVPAILRTLGVKYIIFHSGLYATGTYPGCVDVIGEVPRIENVRDYKLVKKIDGDFVFELEELHAE